MKKILFVHSKIYTKSWSASLHSGWVKDCNEDYEIQMWGKGFNVVSAKTLKKAIDKLEPDYIYATVGSSYVYFNKYHKNTGWLPDLSDIKVPKIFVGCDTHRYPSNHPWLSQFNRIYCRQPWWGKESIRYRSQLGTEDLFNTYVGYSNTWNNIPLFRWSVSEKDFVDPKYKHKKGVFFVGRSEGPLFHFRRKMKRKLKHILHFIPREHTIDSVLVPEEYWKAIYAASALVCPAESNFGGYVPAKIFEYAVSGAAILTNCDLKRYNMEDLDKVVIRYENLDDLREKIETTDFKQYYGLAREVIKNHTHKIRYRELFGE